MLINDFQIFAAKPIKINKKKSIERNQVKLSQIKLN